jgi:hypothetical protein
VDNAVGLIGSLIHFGVLGLYFLVGGAAFFRFRTTLAGILLAGSFGLLGLKGLFVAFLLHFVLSGSLGGSGLETAVRVLSPLATLVLMLLVGVGVALIPRSLTRLQQKG